MNASYLDLMKSEIEHADITHVVNPVHMDGTLTGAAPRLRHYPDCSHFDWADGVRLGTPIPATPEQMRGLRACKTCIDSGGGDGSGAARQEEQSRTGDLCPNCRQMLPLTRHSDNCDG